MALCNPRSAPLHSFLLIFMAIHQATSLSFNYPNIEQSADGITLQNDSSFNEGLQLTKNQLDKPITGSVGRAVYSQPLLLWDRRTRKLTDFTTHFTFVINALGGSQSGDGLAFFLSPYPSVVPNNSAGAYLGLFSAATATNSSANQIVAIEFDTFQNYYDPDSNHVGINVNSIVSVANVTWKSSIKNGSIANAWVSYNAETHNLSVFLTYEKNPVFGGNSSLSFIVDLREVLPETVAVGFSAATGAVSELHAIKSWNFSSTLIPRKKKSRASLVAGVVSGALVVTGLIGFFVLRSAGRWRRRNTQEEYYDDAVDDEFEKGTGPKRFPYHELSAATKNFADDRKLGEGGFGAVYKGQLLDPNLEVAIKKISSHSKQGKKEYISEVKIISSVRHRNLVQLIGWCHERGELMLVYELMLNGSLDTHLYGENRLLQWPERYKIVLGLATALVYLHEEGDQCVVHRDVKPSNVMLDSMFNAKLGDFGLARFVDHDVGSQTTVLAGTMGYLAPECVTTGKASKESDVYSFGVVALEIACGRRPVVVKEKLERVRLVSYVWGLYGAGLLAEAADPRLNSVFDEQQMERLMIVGLWCAHPDYSLRPTMRQAIAVLNSEAPAPALPAQMPVPMYFAPPADMCRFTYTSSLSLSGTTSNSTGSSSSSATSSLLKSHRSDM